MALFFYLSRLTILNPKVTLLLRITGVVINLFRLPSQSYILGQLFLISELGLSKEVNGKEIGSAPDP